MGHWPRSDHIKKDSSVWRNHRSFVYRVIWEKDSVESQAYAKADAIAKQAFRSNRTAQDFLGQNKEITKTLMRNPNILLHDEVPSALDDKSEAIVQNALDKTNFWTAKLGMFAIPAIMCRNMGDVEVTEEDELDPTKSDGEELLRRTFSISSSKEIKEKNLVARASFRKDKKLKKKKKNQVNPEDDEGTAGIKDLMHYNAPEWSLILAGCLGSIIAGAIHPAFSFLLSEFIKKEKKIFLR
ncbi:hypothetical protein Btru_060444 [Bulinus truncatus]|nr:hypothetical protein Btru_060444 [Bulinus truncatus]